MGALEEKLTGDMKQLTGRIDGLETLLKGIGTAVAALAERSPYQALRAKHPGGAGVRMLMAAGYAPIDLRSAGYTAKEMREGGCTALVMKMSLYNAKDMHGAYPASEMHGVYPASEMRTAGYPAVRHPPHT